MSLSLNVRRSTLLPHKAPLTEKNLSDQTGKVFIVTGGSSGLGKELVNILYQRNAKVYIAARSKSKTNEVIEELTKSHPSSTGELIFLSLQLDDLTTIKSSAQEFLSKETRLDVLWNNAGVMVPPQGSKTKQGYELQIGVNNLGHFLFTWFLRSTLEATAQIAPKNSVRVIWVSSSAADGAPHPAIDFDNMDYHREEGIWSKYSRRKAGNVIHSSEFARRTQGSGIVSIKLMASHPNNGAYTELFAGLSPTITEKDNGGWVSPFGKTEPARKDLLDPELGRTYWEWSEAQISPYL
ncbi:Putative Short-chain dehydrogenase [Curvularia clavata]|uniref:Short-chain dehydrogenase n=1 Tax=Curvularia clavata TaxID=95742 RepID=A0A9Q8ZC03_CURCL|nr:Putative Short-chain dehydrogenase [Curvularia clavata]